MNAVIKMDVASENLTPDELTEITGFEYPSKQVDWLKKHGYPYETTIRNGKTEVRVGRWYYRLRIAGVKIKEASIDSGNEPDFSQVS